ncbi:MAG: hypothetical protein A2Y33_05465 [Spirochaetes bacterium GWF1_51_8]|nr:MAG: hypothetical protein A2Y33_05465 [Spirochaetes bacterium GWF1_51_8]
MKKLIAIAAVLMLFGAAAFPQMSDEQHLEKLMDEAKQNMDKKQGETQKSEPAVDLSEGGKTVKTKKTVTVITVITQTQVIDEEVQQKNPAPVVEITPPKIEINIPKPEINVEVNIPTAPLSPKEPSVFGPRPLGVETFIMAEALGICVPGFGLAHFTLGDTTGGMVCLAFTGVSVLSYIGAEIAVETRAIDNPTLYSAWHWGSIALFAAGYLIDIIGAPVYYAAHNAQFTAYVKPVDLTAFAYDSKINDLTMNVVNFGIEF